VPCLYSTASAVHSLTSQSTMTTAAPIVVAPAPSRLGPRRAWLPNPAAAGCNRMCGVALCWSDAAHWQCQRCNCFKLLDRAGSLANGTKHSTTQSVQPVPPMPLMHAQGGTSHSVASSCCPGHTCVVTWRVCCQCSCFKLLCLLILLPSQLDLGGLLQHCMTHVT
jgi:hypothetical protein